MADSMKTSDLLPSAEITYYGLYPEDSAILRFPKFMEAVENHGYLLHDGDGNPVTDDEVDWLVVIDPETKSELFVIVDDSITEVIELAGFRDVLRAMDEFVKSSNGQRLFEWPNQGDITSLDVEFDWEFNFEFGGYVNPELSTDGHTVVNYKDSGFETFTEAFGMSAAEYIERMIP